MGRAYTIRPVRRDDAHRFPHVAIRPDLLLLETDRVMT